MFETPRTCSSRSQIWSRFYRRSRKVRINQGRDADVIQEKKKLLTHRSWLRHVVKIPTVFNPNYRKCRTLKQETANVSPFFGNLSKTKTYWTTESISVILTRLRSFRKTRKLTKEEAKKTVRDSYYGSYHSNRRKQKSYPVKLKSPFYNAIKRNRFWFTNTSMNVHDHERWVSIDEYYKAVAAQVDNQPDYDDDHQSTDDFSIEDDGKSISKRFGPIEWRMSFSFKKRGSTFGNQKKRTFLHRSQTDPETAKRLNNIRTNC